MTSIRSMQSISTLLLLAFLLLGLPAAASPLSVAAVRTGLSPALLTLATAAADRALTEVHVAKPKLLTVIDYSRPSSEPRLWVIDRATGQVVWHELVAHGKGSGENFATAFSNQEGSLKSSLGLFLTQETYQGSNGYSLRLRGLERGVNDHAQERAIVIHGAPYVSADFVRQHGRLGRSWGCPALSLAVAHDLIDEIQGGSLVFAYFPDRNWLGSSHFLEAARTSAQSVLNPGR